MAYVLQRLPAVADIILTPEYEHFAEAVMTSHSKADQQAAIDISSNGGHPHRPAKLSATAVQCVEIQRQLQD